MSTIVKFDQLPVCFQPNVGSGFGLTQYELPEGKALDALLARRVINAVDGLEGHFTLRPDQDDLYERRPLNRGAISKLAAQGVPITIGRWADQPVAMSVVAARRWRIGAQLTGKKDVFVTAAVGLYPIERPYVMSAFLALCSKRVVFEGGSNEYFQNRTALYMGSVGAWGGLKMYSYGVNEFQPQGDAIDLVKGKGIGTNDREALFYRWMIAFGRGNAVNLSAWRVLRAILPKSERPAPQVEDLDVLFVYPMFDGGLTTRLDHYEASRIKRNGVAPQPLFNVEG